MIRQSRENPLGELELLIRPLKNCVIHTDSKVNLENSLETLRNDMNSGHLIEQYEVCDDDDDDNVHWQWILYVFFLFFKRHYNERKMISHSKLVLVKIISIEIVIKMFCHMIKHELYSKLIQIVIISTQVLSM